MPRNARADAQRINEQTVADEIDAYATGPSGQPPANKATALYNQVQAAARAQFAGLFTGPDGPAYREAEGNHAAAVAMILGNHRGRAHWQLEPAGEAREKAEGLIDAIDDLGIDLEAITATLLELPPHEDDPDRGQGQGRGRGRGGPASPQG